MADDRIALTFLDYSARRLRASQKQIGACCERLSEEQMKHRAGDYENSVANLLLHLAGNLRQWVMHGIAEHPDVRERDAEFALELAVSAAEARATFDRTIEEAAAIIETVEPERLLVVIDPQPNGTWRHTPILEAIYKVVGHVEHHAGQIVLLTKQLTASDLDLSMPRKR